MRRKKVGYNDCIICGRRINKWWAKLIFNERDTGHTITICIHSSCLKRIIRTKALDEFEKIIYVIGKGQDRRKSVYK